MKYYMYARKDGDETNSHLFVFDPVEFANDVYDPRTMEFTGVAIEADSFLAAKRAYANPDLEYASIYWCDEPEATVLKRQNPIAGKIQNLQAAIQKAEKAAIALSSAVLAAKIAEQLKLIHDDMAHFAHVVRTSTKDNPELTEEYLFRQIKEKYIEQFRRIPYIPYSRE